MPKTIYFEPLLDLVKSAVSGFNKSFGDKNEYTIFIDAAVVEECAARATVTLNEYNMSGQAIENTNDQEHELSNYFKEAGHFSYWIIKLKPVHIVDHIIVSQILEKKRVDHDSRKLAASILSGRRANILLNEYVALNVAKMIVNQSEDRLIKSFIDEKPQEDRETLESCYRSIRRQNLKKTSAMSANLIQSFRYDVYSTNGMALLFESLIGTGFFESI